MNSVRALQHDLLAGRVEAMSPVVARSWALGAWAYYTADDASLAKQEHLGDFVKAWARFQNMLPAVSELLASWQAADVDATAFKGFVMASQVYPHPALRFFGDVDIYVDPDQIDVALKSLPPGWKFSPCLHEPHEVGYLRPADGSVVIDLHRSFFPVIGNRSGRLKRVTERLLLDRTSLLFGSQTIKCLQLVDLALIGLAVNHGWGGEHWRLKPHDFLDLQYLRSRGVTENDIDRRADELGLLQTWHTYSLVCNPYRSRLNLTKTRTSSYAKLVNDFCVMAEIGLPPRVIRRWGRLYKVGLDIGNVLPTLISVLKQIRRTPNVSMLVIPHCKTHKISSQRNIERGVRWSIHMLKPFLRNQAARSGALSSIVSYRLLIRQGFKPEWIIGRRISSDTQPEYHSWVELGGQAVGNFEEQSFARRYQPIQRIPTPPDLNNAKSETL